MMLNEIQEHSSPVQQQLQQEYTSATIPSSKRGMKALIKQKEKIDIYLEQASFRPIETATSGTANFYKFPNIDFYLNVDSVRSTIGGRHGLQQSKSSKSIQDGNNIAAVNQFKKISYSIVSKKSNGLHIYLSNRFTNESHWSNMVEKLKSFQDESLNELCSRIRGFCEESFCEFDDTASTQADGDLGQIYSTSLDLNRSRSTSDDEDHAQQSKQELKQKDQQEAGNPQSTSPTAAAEQQQTALEQDKIDEIFLQNKHKPIFMWKGANKTLHSIHFNECFLQLIKYTPEEFQMEAAFTGIPKFCTSLNYTKWVNEIMKGIKMLLGEQTSKEIVLSSKQEAVRIRKELVASDGSCIQADFLHYQMHIGMSNVIVEEGVEEVLLNSGATSGSRKKKNMTAQQTTQNKKKEKSGSDQMKSIPSYDEAKRKLTSLEKRFINSHYYQIQDFDLNLEKVCKIKFL